MSRDAILARIKAARAHASGGAPRPMLSTAPASLTSTGDATVARFREAAAAKGIAIVDVPGMDRLPAAVAGYLGPDGRRLRAAAPGLITLDWAAAGLDVATGAAAPVDAAGLSSAMAGIAETGTLMLSSVPDNPATLGLLPETHLVLLKRTTIVATFEHATAMLRHTYGDALPRTIMFVSGASRTGDIGGRIVHGAHGPRRLAVFLLGGND